MACDSYKKKQTKISRKIVKIMSKVHASKASLQANRKKCSPKIPRPPVTGIFPKTRFLDPKISFFSFPFLKPSSLLLLITLRFSLLPGKSAPVLLCILGGWCHHPPNQHGYGQLLLHAFHATPFQEAGPPLQMSSSG